MGFKVALILLGIMIIDCNHMKAKYVEHLDMTETVNKEQLCQLCEDFTTKAIFLLSKNETRTEILDNLHQACFHLHSFNEQCILLVDYYAPLFFLEVTNLQPKLFCEKVNLCEEMAVFHLVKPDDPCTLCHNVVNELLTKLQDPETQIEVIRILFKICNQAENFSNQCKKLVLEYGPLLLANTEKFLEKTDVCAAIPLCKAHKVTEEIIQQYLSAAA